MASVVLGLGTSHSPQMSSGAQLWSGHAQRDEANPMLVTAGGDVVSFAELALQNGDRLASELTPEVWEDKYARAQAGVASLASRLADAAVDVVVVVGDDHKELFGDDANPAIALFLGEELWDEGLTEARRSFIPEDIRPAQWAYHAVTAEPYLVHQPLSCALAEFLNDEGFDLCTWAARREERTLGHAFTFMRRRLAMDRSTAMVPIVLNTYYPPNVPAPRRCWELGRALRRGLEAWPGDERVAIVASGGLSHFVVSEELDRRVLEMLHSGDESGIACLPKPAFRSGNSEILNWIVVGGALADYEMSVVDYIPAYRSLAGTGMGLAFATWLKPDDS